MKLKKWIKISGKTVFENEHWSYRLDRFKIEGAGEGEYHYVHTCGSSLVIPITSDNKILMIEQFRYLNQKAGWEFPCGAVEKGIPPIENAQKELREETGYQAGELIPIGEFTPYTGASDETCSVFLGKELSYSPLPKDENEEFNLGEFSFEEIDAMMKNNVIWDGLALSAWQISHNVLSKIFLK
ncbi:MAG: NUDIX hydrolase [Chlorobi bacterium]|nr:NUDIX hydrolase [Chlorobiota bacterium]